ncbi:MAG: tRNA (adenosine(37)-N6)-threonylcarbamoyltransferase complex ATPase subunit type 1 TsaE [Rhodospirillaceae bacterium]|nr:tRNA (adenosine(37)-N6)-threonylcarbamoyltransferase complex ATPase subunit type 1 TsaE [Rhodospirillaceae bacterium]
MSDLPLLTDIALPTEDDTVALGTALAGIARAGDVIALNGPLGAGKTTLARGFITALTQVDEDVVSPTFTLVQVYDADAAPIWHFDLYRLSQVQDVLELGWDEALSGGISVVEWPERLGALLPKNRLDVMLSSHPGSNERRAALHGGAQWKDRIADMTHD